MRFVLHRRRRASSRFVPVVLHWRRRRNAQMTARPFPPAPPAAATRVSWHPQFHLHFHATTNTRMTTREGLVKLTDRRHSHTERFAAHTTSTRTTTTNTLQTRTTTHTRATHVERRTGFSPSPRKQLTRQQAMPLSSPNPIPPARVERFIEPQRTTSRTNSETTPSPIRPTPRPAPMAPRAQRITRLHFHDVTSRTTREHRTETRERLVHPPELVYRTAPTVQQHDTVQEQPPAKAARPLAIHKEEPARPALQAADFAPALLDRLTDDVIRRVERRVRIERERRGL